jgi:hypothetical protein
VLFFALGNVDPKSAFAVFSVMYVVPMQLLSLVVTALLVKFIQSETKQQLQTPLLRSSELSEDSEERRVPRQYEI